jgi:ATP phosphoribosyltransferase regulatory subunit
MPERFITKKPWLLPEGIEELLPPEAWQLELLRRDLLDLFRTWGYELIVPPFVEFLDSLLTGTGKDLDLQTFKLTDQLSGRLMGVRSDTTPQAARIDAHQWRTPGPTRLCYLGTVLKTRSDNFGGSRAPLQIGAELFGHSGVESDFEIISLMLEMLARAGIKHLHLDLGHVGIFRGLAAQAGLDDGQEQALFEALQRKALPEIGQLLDGFAVAEPVRTMLQVLGQLDGPEALKRAPEVLAAASPEVQADLAYLQSLAQLIEATWPELPVHYDLAELRAYGYQTGVAFAVFVPELGQEIARGGRYDHVGEAFGRARPATGFSSDLLQLMALSRTSSPQPGQCILAPASTCPGLRAKIQSLRTEGQRVIQALPGDSGDQAGLEGFSHRLVEQQGEWQLQAI